MGNETRALRLYFTTSIIYVYHCNFRSKFSEMHHLNDKQRATVESNFTQWWNDFVFRGRTGEIEIDDFIAVLNKDYKADTVKFVAEMTKCFNIFFDVIDTNHDKDISLEEFLIAFKAYGHENVAKDETFFASYKPIDGVVSLSKIVESWIDFVTGEDDTKSGDIVKKAFEGGA